MGKPKRKTKQNDALNRDKRGQTAANPQRTRSRNRQNDGRKVGDAPKPAYVVEESARGGLSLERAKNNVYTKARAKYDADECHPDCRKDKRYPMLSTATAKYAATLADPTIEQGHWAPIPAAYPPVGACGMYRYMLRGSARHSTSSTLGFVTCSPALCGGYNDRLLISHTTASYGSGTINPVATGMGYVPPVTSPFDSTGAARLETAYKFRVTSCLLRVRNVTPLAGRGGTIVMLEPQSHDSAVVADLTFDEIASNPRASVWSMSDTDDSWYEMTWHPTTERADEVVAGREFNRAITGIEFSSYQNPTTPSFNNVAEMIIAWKSPDSVVIPGQPQPQQMEWEAWVVYECIGTEVRNKVEYPRDAEGFGYVSSAISDLKNQSGQEAQGSKPEKKSIKDYIVATLDAAEQVIPVGLNVLAALGI